MGLSPVKALTGLTLGEHLRLRSIRKRLSGTDRESMRPDTAQKTICFEAMRRDGLCVVRPGYYTRMVSFDDMNYELLDDDAQRGVMGQYGRLINYFDPSVSVQLFLFNRRGGDGEASDMLDFPEKDDGHDGIREEYSRILKDLCSKGNNGVKKGKYLIFGTQADDERAARRKLGSIARDVIKGMGDIGAHAREIDGAGWLGLVHEFFNQYAMEPFRFSFDEMERTGRSPRDYVAPPGFDFRFPSRFKAGRMYGSAHCLSIQSGELTDRLLKGLLDLDENITVSVHMRTMDPANAARMLKRTLSNIQKMKIDEQKRAVRSGYDMDILPPDILSYERSAKEIMRSLGDSAQKLVSISVVICCFGRTTREREALEQRVSGQLQQAGCSLRCLMYRQEQGLNAAAPIGMNNAGMERVVTTDGAAVLMPFSTQELFMGGESLYYGINSLSGNMIMADRKALRTPNGVILGTPGSGKSFAAKREILGAFLVTDDDILIADPEQEYFPLVEALGGQVIRLSSDSRQYLNPMDIQTVHRHDREALGIKASFLITLCDMIAGGEHGLGNDERGIIDTCIERIYREYFKEPVPERMPVLGDLYEELLHFDPVNIREELRQDAKEKAVRIANSLVLYVTGSQRYFNHRTNVDITNRIVCFDIRDLGEQLKKLGMLIIQDAVWNRVSANREARKATRYFCDEFHLLLRDSQTARYCVEIWKRFRKWGGIPTAITQNSADFLRSEEIEGILGNSDFLYLLNQNAKDQAILAEKLGLSERQLQTVTNAEPGSGLLLFDSAVIPFMDRYPEDTETFRAMDSRPSGAIVRGMGSVADLDE